MAIVFRTGMSIGAMSAEEDEIFLHDCFVETESADIIKGMSTPQSIILGRTGSGKSAIIIDIENSFENVIRIDPESLSLNYISNSDIIKYFDEIGINLDVFYQLLWRHILAVELIKAKQKFESEQQAKSFIANLFSRFKSDQRKTKALEYLFEFGDSFWADTEERIREVVRNIEDKFTTESGLDLKTKAISFLTKLTTHRSEAETETLEIIHKAQKVVNDVQIQELENVINLLKEDIFDDRLEKYYIIIDDLDKEWASDSIRFKLVRALIETIKKFRRITNLKIVIGMRADLLQTVLEKTSSTGFQTEKYEDLFLRLRWTPEQLKELLQRRVNKLFKDQYTNRSITMDDVMSNRVGEISSLDYIIDRTLDRPRDVISFFNECLISASGQTKITNRVIRDAEIEYSEKRLRSLADEWREFYGDLEPAIRLLKDMGPRFTYRDWNRDTLEAFCLAILDGTEDSTRRRCFYPESTAYFGSTLSENSYREIICSTFYIIGAIGIKTNSQARFEWSYKNRPKMEMSRLDGDSRIAIHPMLHKALGVYADPKRIV